MTENAVKIRELDQYAAVGDRGIFSRLRESGIFAQFEGALHGRSQNNRPRDAQAFFFHAWRGRIARPVNLAVLRLVPGTVASERVLFFTSEGVGFICVDETLYRIGLAKELRGVPIPVRPTMPPSAASLDGGSVCPPQGRDPLTPLARDLRTNPYEVVAVFQMSALFDRFVAAVTRQLHGGNPPRGMERHLAFVISERQVRPVPSLLRARLGDTRGKAVYYFVGQGIGVVVVDGQIVDFVVHQEIRDLETAGRSRSPKSRRHRRPRDPGDAIRGPDDPVRVGASWVSYDGRMAAELRTIRR